MIDLACYWCLHGYYRVFMLLSNCYVIRSDTLILKKMNRGLFLKGGTWCEISQNKLVVYSRKKNRKNILKNSSFDLRVILAIHFLTYSFKHYTGVGIGQARSGFKRPELSLRLIFEAWAWPIAYQRLLFWLSLAFLKA